MDEEIPVSHSTGHRIIILTVTVAKADKPSSYHVYRTSNQHLTALNPALPEVTTCHCVEVSTTAFSTKSLAYNATLKESQRVMDAGVIELDVRSKTHLAILSKIMRTRIHIRVLACTCMTILVFAVSKSLYRQPTKPSQIVHNDSQASQPEILCTRHSPNRRAIRDSIISRISYVLPSRNMLLCTSE